MKTQVACFSLILTVTFSNFLLHAQEKVALLAAVTTYRDAAMNAQPLKYPEADATAIAEVLRGAGYSVTLLVGKDATQAAVQRELTRFQKQGDREGVLLLGFFGHGVQYGESAYFCPFNATLRAVKDKDGKILRHDNGLPRQEPDPETLVSMREMLDSLALSPAGNKLLLADCCREDPHRARGGLQGRAFGSALRVDQLPKNCAALFACSEGEQAFEHDDWKHGAFTKSLLTSLSSGKRITANGLSESVYVGVEELVNPRGQRQRVNSLLTGGLIDLKVQAESKSSGDLGTPEPPRGGVNFDEDALVERVNEFLEKRDMKGARAYVEEMLAKVKGPASCKLHIVQLQLMLHDKASADKIPAALRAALEEIKSDPAAINELVWNLVAPMEQGAIKKNDKVLEIILPAIKVAAEKGSGDDRALVMDSLAHVQCFTGDVHGAIKTEKAAIEISSPELKKQLQVYLQELESSAKKQK